MLVSIGAMSLDAYIRRQISGEVRVGEKMLALGIAFPEVKLVGQLESGMFSVAVFLRAVVVLRSPSLEMYLDYSYY